MITITPKRERLLIRMVYRISLLHGQGNLAAIDEMLGALDRDDVGEAWVAQFIESIRAIMDEQGTAAGTSAGLQLIVQAVQESRQEAS